MPGYRDRAVRAYVIAHLDDFIPSDMDEKLREAVKRLITEEFSLDDDGESCINAMQHLADEWAEYVKGGGQQ